MLRFYLTQSALVLLQMDAKTTLNLGNILLITWVDMTYQINDHYFSSIHF